MGALDLISYLAYSDSDSALRRWLIAGPELARMVHEYEDIHSESKLTMNNIPAHSGYFTKMFKMPSTHSGMQAIHFWKTVQTY